MSPHRSESFPSPSRGKGDQGVRAVPAVIPLDRFADAGRHRLAILRPRAICNALSTFSMVIGSGSRVYRSEFKHTKHDEILARLGLWRALCRRRCDSVHERRGPDLDGADLPIWGTLQAMRFCWHTDRLWRLGSSRTELGVARFADLPDRFFPPRLLEYNLGERHRLAFPQPERSACVPRVIRRWLCNFELGSPTLHTALAARIIRFNTYPNIGLH